MTLQDLLLLAQANPGTTLGLLAAPLGAAGVLQLTPATAYPRGPVAFAWAAVVYAVCVPGILAAVALVYTVMAVRGGLMNLDLVATIGPLAMMAVVLPLVARKVPIGALPGVDRLGGLVLLLGATFATFAILDKLRVLVVFHGSIWTMVLLAAGLFFVFRLGFSRLFGAPKKTPPTW